MKPFKGIIHGGDHLPTYNERYTGFIIGWNNTEITITTSKVIAIQPVRQDICLIETLNSIYLVDLAQEDRGMDAYDRDLLYAEMDAADLD